MGYTIYQWITFFYIYAFFGWLIESTIVSVTQKKLTNRGFLKSPILPIYGAGAIVMLASTLWIKDNIVLIFIFGMIGATLLELIIGFFMEMLLKIRYWDYSEKFMNFKGYICLKSSLFWGVLTIAMVKVVHQPVANVVMNFDRNINIAVVSLIIAITAVEFFIAFKEAFDLQKFLMYRTKIKAEFIETSARIAESRMSDAAAALSDSVVAARYRDAMMAAEEKLEKLKLELDNVKKRTLKYKDTLLKRYPNLTSRSFNEALSDMKSELKTKFDRKK